MIRIGLAMLVAVAFWYADRVWQRNTRARAERAARYHTDETDPQVAAQIASLVAYDRQLRPELYDQDGDVA